MVIGIAHRPIQVKVKCIYSNIEYNKILGLLIV